MIIDAHCDTLTNCVDEEASLLKNHCHFNIERTQKLGGFFQVFAAWVEPNSEQSYERAMTKINALHRFIDKNREVQLITDRDSLAKVNNEPNGFYAMLSIEGGEALEGRLENIETFYQKGVRMLGLTWNGRNSIADGVGVENPNGLTQFGHQVVAECNRSHILIDLSHIAPPGFDDVLAVTTQPVIVSHSNANAICNHRRNLTDGQMTKLIQNNGFVGINWYRPFLSQNEACTVGDIFTHIEHFLSLGGEDHIGFGADLDGMDELPDGLRGVEDYSKIINEMARRNFPDRLIQKICWGNFYRIALQVLK